MIQLSRARPWPERAGVANSRTAVVGDEAHRSAGIAARIVQIAVEAHAAAVGDEILHGQAMPRRHDECIRAKRVRHERKRLARATFDAEAITAGRRAAEPRRECAVGFEVGSPDPFLQTDIAAQHAGHAVREFDTHRRSEEHTSELQSLMRNSYAVFCLKKKNKRDKTISI